MSIPREGKPQNQDAFANEMKRLLEEKFGDKLCPAVCLESATLETLAELNCNVIVIYSNKPNLLNLVRNIKN